MKPFITMDLESSGLPDDDKALDDPAQAWAVSIAAELSDGDGRPISHFSVVIKPEGRKIKEKAENVHGISAREAEIWGIRENAPLMILQDFAGKAQVVVSYSTLDRKVIASLFAKLERDTKKPPGTFSRKWTRPGLEFIDIMAPACQNACKLSSGFDSGEYKWPTLDEASSIILGEDPRSGNHRAWDDMRRTSRLYLALRERGHFDI